MLQEDEGNRRTVRVNVFWIGANFDEEIEEVKRDRNLDGDDESDGPSGMP